MEYGGKWMVSLRLHSSPKTITCVQLVRLISHPHATGVKTYPPEPKAIGEPDVCCSADHEALGFVISLNAQGSKKWSATYKTIGHEYQRYDCETNLRCTICSTCL